MVTIERGHLSMIWYILEDMKHFAEAVGRSTPDRLDKATKRVTVKSVRNKIRNIHVAMAAGAVGAVANRSEPANSLINMGVHLIGVYLTGEHLMGVYLMDIHFMGMHLTSVHLTGVYLMSVRLTGVCLIGIHLTGMHLIAVYITGVSRGHVFHRRES